MCNSFKTNPILILALGIFIAFSSNIYSQVDNKKALVIGVGAYPAQGGWATINSLNDVKLITSALIAQGFKSENILTLQNEHAVKQNILKALEKDLFAKLNKGDVVYFQFSGHGQQCADKSGDEVDGLDECIVPYDSPKKFQPGVYEGENLITDDALDKSLGKIREKIGPTGQLMVVLDACHSGTGTRGFTLSRGTTEVMADENYLSNNKKIILNKDNNDLQKSNKPESYAPMVAFFGSAQNQLNYEMTNEAGEHYGSLSYALAKSLSSANPNSSYRGLFDNIRIEMSKIAPLQQPQSEGELDMTIANGKLLGKPVYYKMEKAISEKEFLMNGGELHGIYKNSKIAVYPQDTRDISKSNPLSTGTIIKSFPTKSTVQLDSAITPETLASAWIYVTEKSLGNVAVSVYNSIEDSFLKSKLDSILYTRPYVKPETENANLIILQQPNGKIYLNTKADYTLDSITLQNATLPSNTEFKLHKKIKEYLHGDIMRNMEMEGSDIRVSFKIVLVDSIRPDDTPETVRSLHTNSVGEKSLKLETLVKLLIHNEGIKPAYFSVIDIQPDNQINILLPSGITTAEEMRIMPDQKILVPIDFVIGQPLGPELFKLIASDKPIDLKSTLGTRGGVNQNPLEKIFNETKSDEFLQTRGGKAVSFPISDIHIYSDSFIIIK